MDAQAASGEAADSECEDVIINTELTHNPAESGDGVSGRGHCLHAVCSSSGGVGGQVTRKAAMSWFTGHWAPLELVLDPWQGFSLYSYTDQAWDRSSSVQLI